MEILVENFRPRMDRLFRKYWEYFIMLVRAGRYYVALFTDSRGVTQDEPLSPTIFNMVLDTVIRHWAMRVDR